MKISQNTLHILFTRWSKNRHQDENLKHLRFGQYFGNLFLKTESDPVVYYQEDANKAYALIHEKYVDTNMDVVEDFIFQALFRARVSTSLEVFKGEFKKFMEAFPGDLNEDLLKDTIEQLCVLGTLRKIQHQDVECYQPDYWSTH